MSRRTEERAVVTHTPKGLFAAIEQCGSFDEVRALLGWDRLVTDTIPDLDGAVAPLPPPIERHAKHYQESTLAIAAPVHDPIVNLGDFLSEMENTHPSELLMLFEHEMRRKRLTVAKWSNYNRFFQEFLLSLS